ncbi:side tail fiber protein [Escherichia phage vB_Eco_SLUR76]|nr:side tail fiber protein [Escherichia phage vB_Eco_SLUR76]VAY28108.1 side tail fiber protein [Escherichia phage vB_Eco_SLUR26]
MATRLYGTLRDGLGKPIINATVALLAKGNSLTVLSSSEAIFKTSATGTYDITVQTGYYKVIIGPQGSEPYKAGEIAIYADSKEGTLNNYLTTWAPEELTPEVIAQVRDLVSQAETAKNASSTSATKSEQERVKAEAAAKKAEDTANGMKASIGLTSSARHVADITVNPSSFLGFLRILRSSTVGYPGIANSDNVLGGFISPMDGSPGFIGLFIGDVTGTVYSYKWTAQTGTVWWKGVLYSQVDRLAQASTETALYSPNRNAKIIVENNISWGAFDVSGSRYLPLPVNRGGTGALTIADAKTNLQIPEGGLSNIITINAPEGSEDEKYYPIIIYTGNMNGYGNMLCPVDIVTKSAPANDPMNNSSFFGYIRCGGWSDLKDAAFGYLATYDPKEVGILCVKGSKKDYSNHIAFYIHKKAFPIRIQVGYKANVIVPIEDYVLGTNGVRFKFGVSAPTEGDTENNVTNILNFEGGGSGFYSNSPFRQGSSQNFALTNNLSTGDSFIASIPSFTLLGKIQATQGFIGYSDSTEGRSFISRRTNAEKNITLDQTELRAGDSNGQIVVRDMSSAARHQFFNFNLDGTFSSPNGLLSATGSDWNGQINTVNKFYGIAGGVNGPEHSTNVVYGGVHVGFSGNYAFQIAGRRNNAFIRTIEASTNGEWLKLLTSSFGANTPLDGRDCFISDGSTNPSWVPTYGAGFQSCYATSRIGQAWIGADGKMYYRFLLSDNPQASKTDSPWHQLAALDIENIWTQPNTFNNRLLTNNLSVVNGGRITRILTGGNSAKNIELYTWGNSDRPTVIECKVKNPDTDASDTWIFYGQQNPDNSLQLQVNGAVNCVTVNQSSDRDLKDNIQVISSATEAIRKMNGYTYTLKENGLPYAGVIAQEVMEALPEAVSSFTKHEYMDGQDVEGNDITLDFGKRYLSVDYSAVTGLLVQVCREADDRITKLETEVEELKKLVATLVNKESLP